MVNIIPDAPHVDVGAFTSVDAERHAHRILRPWRSRLLGALLVLSLLAPCSSLFWRARDVPQLGQFQDDGLYLTAAKSLVEGNGYRIASLPGAPYQTKYPPVYPWLLLLAWKLNHNFPQNLALAVLVNWLLWLAFLAMTWVFLCVCDLPRGWRLAAWAFVATSPMCAYISLNVLAEAAFSALLFAALIMAERSSSFERPATAAFIAGTIGGVAYLAKSSAIPLLLTTPVVFVSRKQYAQAARFVCGMAPFIAAWTIWTALHKIPSSDPIWIYYTDYLGFYRINVHAGDVLRMAGANIMSLLSSLAKTLAPGLGSFVSRFASLLIISGAVRLVRAQKLAHTGAFAVAYAAQLILWNFCTSERFLFPLIPLLAAGAVYETLCGARLIMRACERKGIAARGTPAIAGLLAAVLLVPFLWRGIARDIPQALEHRRTALAQRRIAYAWINRHLSPTDKLAAYNDTELYLYTGRQAIRRQPLTRPYLYDDVAGIERTVTTLGDFARQHGLKYIFSSHDDYEFSGVINEAELREKLLNQNPGLGLIFDSGYVRIYKVN